MIPAGMDPSAAAPGSAAPREGAFVADLESRAIGSCDEWTEARWVTDGDGLDCPENVRQLLGLALAAPPAR